MIPRVYVLFGGTGEYSDRQEWTVAVYLDQEQAELHKAKLTEVAKELKDRNDNEDDFYRWDAKTPYDPKFQLDYTGTRYWIEGMPLVRHLDEWLEEVAQNVDPEGTK